MRSFKTKRIEVTIEITIPDDWTIGQTEEWLENKLKLDAKQRIDVDKNGQVMQWNPRIEVGMQRSVK